MNRGPPPACQSGRPVPGSPGVRLLKQIYPLAIVGCDPGDRLLARELLAAEIDARIPKGGAADGEPNEAGDRCRRGQPLTHLLVVLAAPQDDAADVGTPAALGRRDHLDAVLLAIQALDLPDVGLNSHVLELVNRLD